MSATTLFVSLNSCKKEEEKTSESAVFFVQGKALIYTGKEYDVFVNEDYSAITSSIIKYNDITRFSTGVEAINTKSLEDAIELATAIVGEENIIYMDYEGKDLNLSTDKKLVK